MGKKLAGVDDPLLRSRLAIEILSKSTLAWAACYARSGGSLVPIAAFGFSGTVPVLPSAALSSATYPLRTSVFGESIGAGTVCVVAAGPNRFFMLPAAPELSGDAMEALGLACATSSRISAGTESFEPLSEPYEARIVDHGRSKKYMNVSLFLMDVSRTVRFINTRCPNSLSGSFEHEVSAFCSKSLGSAGKSGACSAGKILCAFYGHCTGDPELIAVQTKKNVAKAFSLPDPSVIETGPYLSVLLADSDAESMIRSFIDGLHDS